MATRILSLILGVTQLMSWAAAPLNLCISNGGSVCVEIGGENCNCCKDVVPEKHDSKPSACCAHCDAEESGELAVAVRTNPCDCTHIPLMVKQVDSIRPSIASCTTHWVAPISWLHARQEIVPRTVSALILHWDRRHDSSCLPVALTTTVLRC